MKSLALLAAAASTAAAQTIDVVSVSPQPSTIAAPRATTISVTFDQPVDPATVTTISFWAYARWSGPAEGTISFSDDDHTITLTPDAPFSAGETVTVILSHDIAAASGDPLRQAGYSFQFWTAANPANLQFTHLATLDTKAFPGEPVRSSGGHAADLDNDGFLDLTIVNEDSEDLRVFMNLADATGAYTEFLAPPNPVGNRASPNEPGDFNRDGFTDIAVCNINDNNISILHGNGDGTYTPSHLIPVGSAPRGIALLDVDGDGDLDIANTNSASNNMSLLINDGSGVFAAPVFWQGGVSGEWALAAADMNEDGILDLVIGANAGNQIVVATGNGDATFTPQAPQSSGGSTWMLCVGDVNADGHEDVACANSTTNNASILLGNGDGTLQPPSIVFPDAFPLATDLGDIDGDADLDWILSSFAGDWTLWLNDGDGTFGFGQEINAPDAASCALMFDLDNDHDLDLALIDELEDVVELYEHGCPADFNADNEPNILDFVAFQSAFTAGSPTADCNDSGDLNILDFVCFQTVFQEGCR